MVQIRVDTKRVGNETTNSPVVFIFSRTGTSSSQTHLNGSLQINYELFGTAQKGVDYIDPVSYTHLTLPTILLV